MSDYVRPLSEGENADLNRRRRSARESGVVAYARRLGNWFFIYVLSEALNTNRFEGIADRW